MPLTSFYPWHWTEVPAAELSMLLYNTGAGLTATLTDTVNYSLLQDSWSPAIAGDKPGQSGGRPFNRVIETIDLLVLGTTAAVALQNLKKLVRLLKLAEEWRNDMTANVTTTPTLFEWQPKGSLSGPWKALVVGRVDKTRNYLGLPIKFNEQLALYQIEGVKLEFVREGEWLGSTETTAASGAAASGSVMSVTFANNLDIPSPTKITLDGLGGTAISLQENLIFIAHTATDIQVVQAETAGAGTIINENANNAAGTAGNNALRLTASSTYDVTSMLLTTLAHKTVAVYALMRSASADASWRLYVETKEASGVTNGTSRVTTFAPGVTTPWPHFLGTVTSAAKEHTQLLFYWATDGIANLDIDYFVIIGLDNPVNQVIRVRPGSDVTTLNNVIVDPRQLTAVSPRITANSTVPQTFSLPWDRGNGYLLSSGTNLSVLWMNPRSNNWRWALAGAPGTLVNFTLTAERQEAALIPE